MKKNLFLLFAALSITPALADNLNPDEWYTSTPEAFIFNEDGTMTAVASGRLESEGVFDVLSYTGQEYKMMNGSSVAITLQFDNAEFLKSENVYRSFDFYTKCNFADIGEKGIAMCVSNEEGEFCIYNDAFEDYYSLTDGTTTVTLTYRVKDNYLYFDYMINGEDKATVCYEDGVLDTNSNWNLSFYNTLSEIRVTDVTFASPVPEPATATLSLLALAGLATRRRRASR